MPPPNTPSGTPPNLSPFRSTVPPNTPIYSGSPQEQRSPRRSHRTQNGRSVDDTSAYDVSLPHNIDLRSLVYVTAVDENLLCPICHVALIEPLTTSCDHTFCKDCISRAWSSNEICPIDRLPMKMPEDVKPSAKIILNQLDALQVKCFCCQAVLPRSMVQNHLDRYCSDALVKCPDKTCMEVIKRKDVCRGCLHHDTNCPDCNMRYQEVDLEFHREFDCKERHKDCEHCGIVVLRCKLSDHIKVCPEVTAPCKWAKYGCQHESRRKDLAVHAVDCKYTTVGEMADMLQAEISTLREQVHVMNEKDKIQERRIKFLENHPLFNYSDVSSHTVSNLPYSSPAELPESRDQYLLSLLESQESKVDQLSLGLTEMEAKQTMMLFNETIPIKEQLAELRSNQGVIGMHVRWLMNFRMAERRPGPGPGSSGGSDASGPGGDSQSPRRLSDSMRDIITKL